MAASSQPVPAGRGPSAGCALVAAVGGAVLAALWRQPARARGGSDELLFQQGVWAAGMAVVGGLAVASLRRSPERQRPAAFLALAICVAGVAGVAVQIAEVLAR